MQLYWEDAYFDSTTSRISLQNGFCGGKSRFISFSSELDAKERKSSECPVRLAVTNLSSHIYILGEGIVGNVASKEKHEWIFPGEYNSKLLPECPEDCQLQFAAGIKTILLVPINSLGVVQLGSLHKVTEDIMAVAQITDLFRILRHTANNLDMYAPITMCPMEDLSASSPLSNSLDPIHSPTSAKKDFAFLDVHEIPNNELSDMSYQLQADLPIAQDVHDMSLFIDYSTQKALCHELEIDSTLSILNQSVNPYHIIEDGRSVIPDFVDELNEFSAMTNIFTPIEPGMSNFYVDTREQYDVESTESLLNERCLDLPFYSELHKVLGFESLDEYDDQIWNAILSKTDELSHSTSQTAVEKTSGSFIEKSNAEQLLDSIIANLSYASDDDVSDNSRCIRSSSNSSVNFPDSTMTHFKTDGDILGFDDSVPSRLQSCPPLPKSTVSCLTNEEKHTNDTTIVNDKRGSKSSQRSQRKGRISDSRRPRDRQLIQDRLKELRELIPDGSKCSIDVLLERTVKHMSYLQSIPDRAEKLKQSTHRKIKVDGHNRPGTEVHKNGASWAYEMGGQPQVCPLIVENLDQPGQMLVEMLCKEYGLFLEIVQVIKCLKLTILKGVMETRSNELWAHFIIEGSRGFYRMDILLPLMQLLQRN